MKKTAILFILIPFSLCLWANGGAEKDSASGNSNFNATGYPIVDEEVTLSMATQVSEASSLAFFQEQQEVTNVKIDWIEIASNDWATKINLMLASSDLPDALYHGYVAIEDKDIIKYAGKAVIPLDPLFEYAPNLKKVFEKRPEYKATITALDGHIYSVPQINERAITANTNMAINKDWLDQLGLDIPETTDEFANVLRAFKEAGDINGNGKDDEWPFSYGGYYIYAMFGSFGYPDNQDHRWVDGEKVIFTNITEGYKKAIMYFHGLYEEGLVYPESYTADRTIYMANLKAEPPVFGGFNTWTLSARFGTGNTHGYTYMKPLEGPEGDRNWKMDPWEIHGKTAFVITSANEHPEVTMRWMDRLLDPLKSYESFWGTIGHNWTQNSDGSLTPIPAPEGMAWGSFVEEVSPYSKGVQIILKEDYQKFGIPAADQEKAEICQEYYTDFLQEGLNIFPKAYMTEEELSRLSQLQTDIKAFVDEKYTVWIMNGGIEDEWDFYLKKLDDMGFQEYMDIYQTVYKRYLSNL